MLRVTWEWLGGEPALDLANTVAVSDGIEHDLLVDDGYERWAGIAASSPALDAGALSSIMHSRSRILELRDAVLDVLAAVARADRPPRSAVAELNRASRRTPGWRELRPDGDVVERSGGSALDRILATYARSAMEIAAEGASRLRVCPAPSCGMYFRPTRSDQRWCSVPCGTRARVARHYRARRSVGAAAR
jgi:predicted RNA-binding Zn ribbon-like protein